MGRIKSKLVKRTSKALLKEKNKFTEKFENNKELLKGNISSKKVRNQIAGYLARLKKTKNK